MPLLALLFVPIVAALLVALLPAKARTRAATLAGLSTIVGLFSLARHFPRVRAGEPLIERTA
jgi:hypothetical protein